MDQPALQSLPPGPALFGDGTPPTLPITSSVGTFEVGRSGQTIFFHPTDSQGNPLVVTGVRSTDDVQIINLVGSTVATSMTLSLGDRTTTPIPLQPQPPVTSFTATATLPHPGNYDLRMTYRCEGIPPTGRACTRALVQVFDGTTLVGSVPLDQSQAPDANVDLIIPNMGAYRSLGTFAITTGTLTVWLSGAAGTGCLLMGSIRIEPHGNTDPTQVGFIDPTFYSPGIINGNLAGKVTLQRFGDWTADFAFMLGTWRGYYRALPTGTQPSAFPRAEDVVAALQTMPTIPFGAVVVSAVTNESLSVHFGGELSGQTMPTLVCSDAAFAVLHDDSGGSSVGGQNPIVTINGAPYPLRAASVGTGQSVVAFHLVQDAPVVQYRRFGEGLFYPLGYPVSLFDVGFSGNVALPTQAGLVATCRFDAVAGPADFELAITWPTGDSAGDHLECVVQDGRGITLARLSGIDQSQPPSNLTTAGTAWLVVGRFRLSSTINQITVQFNGSGTAGKHCLIDSIRLTRTSPARGTQIAAGDTVTIAAPSGFVTTAAGPVRVVQAATVQGRPDRRFPALDSKTRTMDLGINCDSPNYYGADSCFSNYAIMMDGPIGLLPGPDGYPTQLAPDPYQDRGLAGAILSFPSADGGGAGRGAANCSDGIWILQWTSGPDVQCELLPYGGTTTLVEDTSRRVVGATNRRFYQVTHRWAAAPSLVFRVFSQRKNADGTFACDLGGLVITPPDVDPQQVSRWRPSFLTKLVGLQCFRFMDLLGTNNINLSRFEHFPSSAQFPLGYKGGTITAPILSIGPPEADPFCEGANGPTLRVVTATPHGLSTGFQISLRTTDGSSLGLVQSTIVDSATGLLTTTQRDPTDPTDGLHGYVGGLCRVIDATTFQVGLELYYGLPARMTNTLTPAHGIVTTGVGQGVSIAPSEAAELCAVAGLEPWVNIPWLADDDCVTRMAQAFVNGTPPGVRVHVEYGNEPWNYLFLGSGYAVRMSRMLGRTDGGSMPYYIQRMGQVQQIFRDVWREAGRPETDIRRVCGTQQVNPGGTTTPAIQEALRRGIAFDELAVASYFSNNALQGPSDDLLTREQLLDLVGLCVDLGLTAKEMAAHGRAIADSAAAHPDQDWIGQIALVNYEGGPDTLTTPTMTSNLGTQNHGVHRDPDFLEIMVHWLASLEDAGVKLFNIFTMYGIRDTSQWGVYEQFDTQPGTGQVALDPANRDDFENLAVVKSETAGALRQWQAMRIPAAPTRRVSRTGLRSFGLPTAVGLHRSAM